MLLSVLQATNLEIQKRGVLCVCVCELLGSCWSWFALGLHCLHTHTLAYTRSTPFSPLPARCRCDAGRWLGVACCRRGRRRRRGCRRCGRFGAIFAMQCKMIAHNTHTHIRKRGVGWRVVGYWWKVVVEQNERMDGRKTAILTGERQREREIETQRTQLDGWFFLGGDWRKAQRPVPF